MSIWYPHSGITYQQYLQTNSFIRDITGQIQTSGKRLESNNLSIQASVSEQTQRIVAGQQELSRAFGEGFDRIESTLQWGFSHIGDALTEIDSSIESLHSDFNYNMGLLLEALHIQNSLLSTLVEKLDVINKTLESPTLTQAREFYKIGCDRLAKGLLDKALEAFSEAEKKNDTDFFTQFHIGKLYLYGIDDDDDVIDLEKAKEHLLLAARYAKAEIGTDPTFRKLAAEALLHASISLYAKLGEEKYKSDGSLSNSVLEEARRLTKEATLLCPELCEAAYHTAKYSSMLNDEQEALSNLETAILADRNYAVKVDIDHVFDPMRPLVINLLTKLREAKLIEATECIKRAREAVSLLSVWYPKDGSVSSYQSNCSDLLRRSETALANNTYFGFLDAVLLGNQTIETAKQWTSERAASVRKDLWSLIENIRLPASGSYPADVKQLIRTANDLRSEAKTHTSATSFEGIQLGIDAANRAKEVSSSAWQRIGEQETWKRQLATEDQARRDLAQRRSQASSENASAGMRVGGILGFVIGFVGCIGAVGTHTGPGTASFYLCGLPFVGVIVGALIGGILGGLSGQLIR